MTTFNTGNPVGSTDVYDRYDNSENLDNFSNGPLDAYADRFGVSRQSLQGIRNASQYVDIGAYAAGLVFTSRNQVFSYNPGTGAEFYSPGPAITLPYTTTGAGAGEIANFRSVGDAILRSDLAAPDGGERVGFGTTTIGAELERIDAQSTSPEQHGYSAGGTLVQRTAAVQAAFDYANTNKVELRLNKTYIVDTIQIFNHTSYSITGTGVIAGAAVTARSAVLEIKNCTDIKSFGSISISASENLNYQAATKIWADQPGGSSLLYLNFNQIGARIGWLIGDLAQPDRLLSEMTLYGGYTYHTPQPLVVIGIQAVVETSGYQLIAEDVAAFPGTLPVIVTAVGSVVHGNGGEWIQAASSLGFAMLSNPIDSPGFANGYGSIHANGIQIESAGLLFLAYNPGLVPSVAANTGGVRLSSCSGYHSFSGVSFQGAAADFSGSIVVDASCDFYAPALRTSATVDVSGPAQVRLAPEAFLNFKQGLGAITGGIARFEAQDIFTASNLNGAACPVAVATVLKFVDIPSIGNNLRFSTSYNPATGVFTVPPGGLKNVKVFTQFSCIAARPTSEITVLEAGSFPWGIFGVPHKYVSETTFIGDLAAGSQITLRIQNSDATFNFGSVPYDRIVISASC